MKAPQITGLQIYKLAANYLHIRWHEVSENFFYEIQIKENNPDIQFTQKHVSEDPEYFFDNLLPEKEYILRVRQLFEEFEPQDWVYSEPFTTFKHNAFTTTTMDRFYLSKPYVRKKFYEKQDAYVDFNNDAVMASLMNESFVYDSEIEYVSSVKNKIVKDKEYHEIQGDVPTVCYHPDRTCIFEIDGKLYATEKWQAVVKVSADKGQTWQYYKAFNDRLGWPVQNSIACQNGSTTYVLGYDKIFNGRSQTDIRWQTNAYKMQDGTLTFAKLNQKENSLGYEVEIFGNFVQLPGTLMHKAEAISCSEKYVFVAGQNHIRMIDINNAPIDTVESSPTFGQKQWDPKSYEIATCANSVIKKMEYLNDKLFILVTGSTEQRYDNPSQIRNVKRTECTGIYTFDPETKKIERVFGNTEEERSHIDHNWTDMSQNGKELFFDYYQPGLNVVPDQVDENYSSQGIANPTRYEESLYYLTDKKRHLSTLRTIGYEKTINPNEPLKWYFGPQSYYGEAKYTYMARGKTRSWLTPVTHKAVVVYPERDHTYNIDLYREINKEVAQKGNITIYAKDINFSGFNDYSNGILFYTTNGVIIGYYEFEYRVKGEANIFWKPENVILRASLENQIIEIKQEKSKEEGLVTPNIVPMLNKMGPEHYLSDEGFFRTFVKYYLEFISEGTTSHYSRLVNLIKNKYPKEEDSIEFLWSEMGKRNIYLSKEKREQVTRFFETRKYDFYSAKGTEASYKFLFKLLYDEDVELEIEQKNTAEYYITVDSDTITEDIVGTTIWTPTAKANVTYIEKVYDEGVPFWQITIHNVYGEFIKGQQLSSDDVPDFTGMISKGVKGKFLSNNSNEYLGRGKSYYVMRVKSALQTSRYRDDVMRFLHPVGFGFIGVTIIQMIIRGGLDFKHFETSINIYKNLRFDAGIPLEYPETLRRLDSQNNYIRDVYFGEIQEEANPLYGKNPLENWPNYDTDEKTIYNMKPSERRKKWSPLFCDSWCTWQNWKHLIERRLKEDMRLPRDKINTIKKIV